MFYFKLAEHFNIIDRPNERSSHSERTIRGGGIIFPITLVIYVLYYNDISPLIILGALGISLVSFLDDIYTLPNKVRILVHLASVTALIYVLSGITTWAWWITPVLYVFVIGCINAFNFMDGINGLTGLYSIIVFGSLYYMNRMVEFTDSNLIIVGIIACFVFLFFNFRKNAKCFAGDVGSVCIAYWITCLIAFLVVKTGDLKYVLFLSLYGVDTILTIGHRLILRQNIFLAHRLHFYQILVNERRVPHLVVASFYGIIQLIINWFVIVSKLESYILFSITVIPLCVLYILVKRMLMDIK